jgi:hypothetical protein
MIAGEGATATLVGQPMEHDMKTIFAMLLMLFVSACGVRAEDAPVKEEKKPEVKKDDPKKEEKKFVLGEVGCLHCSFDGNEHAPAIKIDGKIYLLKALPTADEKTKKAIENVAEKKDISKVKVVGKQVDENNKSWYYIGEMLMAD